MYKKETAQVIFVISLKNIALGIIWGNLISQLLGTSLNVR